MFVPNISHMCPVIYVFQASLNKIVLILHIKYSTPVEKKYSVCVSRWLFFELWSVLAVAKVDAAFTLWQYALDVKLNGSLFPTGEEQ